MNKLIIAKLIFSVVASIILYALFSFVMWDLSVKNWGDFTRFFYAIFIVFLGVVVGKTKIKN